MYSIPPIKRLGGIEVPEGCSYPWFHGKVHYCYDQKGDLVSVAYPIPLNFLVSLYLRTWYFLRNGARFLRPMIDYRQGYEDGWKDHKNHRAHKLKVCSSMYRKSSEWKRLKEESKSDFSTKKAR